MLTGIPGEDGQNTCKSIWPDERFLLRYNSRFDNEMLHFKDLTLEPLIQSSQ